MKYLDAKQLLLIYSLVVDETGGSHGVRDRHALLSIVNLPQQHAFDKELYPTMFEKAATYARGIIKNHPFIDGNKRTGITAAMVFLENNGYVLDVSNQELEACALRIATKKVDIADIGAWLREHCEKI